MKRLYQIEYTKIRTYRAFWILFGLYILFMILAMVGFDGFINATMDDTPTVGGMAFKPRINQFPDIWQYLTYIAGYFHYILGVLVIILATNEFSYKTIRQSVINGQSRGEFLMGKVLMIIAFALVATLVVFLTVMILGLLNTDNLDGEKMFRKVAFLPAFFIQCIGFSMLALLISLLVKRAGFAIGILLLYGFVAEKIAVYYIPEPFHLYMPVEAMDNLIQLPIMQIVGNDVPPLPTLRETLLTVGYSVGFGALCYWLMKRRDL